MAKARNPKSEIRKKSEGRSPKGPVQRLQPQLRLVALTRARPWEADPSSVAHRPRSLSTLVLLRRVDRFGFRISGFGLRIFLMPPFH
jgi:hypothetical protein